MPFGLKPECVSCKATSATIWKRNEKGEVFCSPCYPKGTAGVIQSNGGTWTNNNNNNNNVGTTAATTNPTVANQSEKKDGPHPPTYSVVLRKSTRARTVKNKNGQNTSKSNATKGKGRRIIFKKSATKAPTAVATPCTTECVFYKGSYFQIGDVVSMMDVEGGIFYAQIRGLLQDQYCEKSAVITWLIPTTSSPKDRFDPSTYILGPEEEIPRKLECMDFICHAPSDYYKAKNSPYPTVSYKPESCFIWTRLRPHSKTLKRNEDIYAEAH